MYVYIYIKYLIINIIKLYSFRKKKIIIKNGSHLQNMFSIFVDSNDTNFR